MSKTRQNTVKALRKEGKSYKEIAQIIGTNTSTVGHYIKKSGLVRRRYKRKSQGIKPTFSVNNIVEKPKKTGLYLHLSNGTSVKYDLIKEALNLED